MSKRSITKLPDLLKPWQRLKLAREDAAYTQEEVAAELDISLDSFRNWEYRGFRDGYLAEENKMPAWRQALLSLLNTRQISIQRHIEWLENKEE